MDNSPRLFIPLLDNGNGSVMASFAIDCENAFKDRNVLRDRASDSHPNRGMNKIANAFLESDCDLWINIDADIRFRRVDIDRLLEHAQRGVQLVYGIYPKKEDITMPCLGTFDPIGEPDPVTGLLAVRRAGRGFMLVARDVLERMKEDNGGPALRYHNHGKVEYDFFPSGVVTGDMSSMDSNKKDEHGYPVREWISEDWYFCERARALGIPTYVDARIALGHTGLKEYWFNSDQVTRLDSSITRWQEIHGWFDYADLYQNLVDLIPNGGRFVEVGSWMGRSIGAFYEMAQTNDKYIEVHCVDTFTGEPANGIQEAILTAHGGNIEKHFRANMAALGLDPNVIVSDSASAAGAFTDGSCDAVFIDGDHHKDAVRDDIKAWLPKVKPGGVLCGHDINEPGVLAAVRTVLGTDFETLGRCWLIRLPISNVETSTTYHPPTERTTSSVH